MPCRDPSPNETMLMRHSFSKYMSVIYLLIVWGISVCPNPAAAAERPNIVFILADDLGWGELGCYGQTKIRTPHLDRLASQGMRFTHAYSGAPVCAPARCTLMTGLHLGHAQVRGNKQVTNANGKPGEGQHPLVAGTVTLPSTLKAAGYVTGAMGKWGLGPVDSTGAPHHMGIDHFFGYNCQSVAHSYYPPHLWRNTEKVPQNSPAIPGGKKQPEGEVRYEDWEGQQYAPDLMLQGAVEFLKDHRDESFFLYLPFIEPHVAMQPPRRIVETYPPEWDTRPYRGQCGYTPYPRPRAGYAALITSLDEHVGTILRTLDELDVAKNTLVVFTSDNGATHAHAGDADFGIGGADTNFFNSTAGLRDRKGSVHEGGLRVPLIVRWPGRVAAGTQSDMPTYFPDQFPTLCAAVDIETPAGLDGISLLPTLTGTGEQSPRNPLVWVFPEYGGQVAVRMGDMKAVRTNLSRPKQIKPWEVYDLAHDPQEVNDLAAQRPEVIQAAEQILQREMSDNATFPVKLP